MNWRENIVIIALLLPSLTFAQTSSSTLPWHLLTAQANINIDLVDLWSQLGGIKKDTSRKDKGTSVKLIQYALKRITDSYQKEKITSIYGSSTEAAIKELQQKFNLPIDGKVASETKKLINDFYFNQLCPKPGRDFPDLTLAQVDKQNGLPFDYVPVDLVNISTDMNTKGILCLREEAARNLNDIFNDAINLGYDFRVTSAFRRPEIQQINYKYWWKKRSLDQYRYDIAPPQYSEHQLGTAVDLTSRLIKYQAVNKKFGETQEGKWLTENAWRYGFILSYPKDKRDLTGYNYEPWHFRYVGKDTAEFLHEHNMSYGEFINSPKN